MIMLHYHGPAPIAAAYRETLERQGVAVNWAVSGEPGGAAGEQLGVLAGTERAEAMESFIRLARLGCAQVFILFDNPAQTWTRDGLNAIDRQAFKDAFIPLKIEPADLAARLRAFAALGEAEREGLREAAGRCRRILCAELLFQNIIQDFAQQSRLDLSNQFLGPLRMLALARRGSRDAAEQRNLDQAMLQACRGHRAALERFLEKLASEMIPARAQLYGELGHEIDQAARTIAAWLKRDPIDLAVLPSDAIEVLLESLAECRLTAAIPPGEWPAAEAAEPVEPLVCPREPRQPNSYRVLVVDDHAAAWRPVLEAVARLLKTAGRPTDFEFSRDGQTVFSDGASADIYSVLADYDAVLLDVYLPGRNGLELLQEILQQAHGLPVILWTASLDIGVSLQASQANGFLQKKSVDCRQIAEALLPWLEPGRSRRSVSLLNPYFDHVIQDPEYRRFALEFSACCLKHVDSFHALDTNYFRFFNDHGGRHLARLLEILEKLLRPLVFARPNDPAFPEVFHAGADAKTRELEFLCLYLAVLCHEFGMFPIYKYQGDRITYRESFEFATPDELKLVRRQHAVRGMKILTTPEWQSNELRPLLREFKKKAGPAALARVVLLVGYHAQYLSLNERDFCRREAGAANPESNYHLLSDGELQDLLGKQKSILQAEDGEALDRLRRLCAVLRLADAVDIDHTRVPVDLLARHDMLSIGQNRENTKRRIVEEVRIDRGRIIIEFRTPWPNCDALIDALRSMHTDCLKEASAGLVDKLLQLREQRQSGIDAVPFCRALHDACDAWLDAYLSYGRCKQIARENPYVLQIAALSVMCELRLEYEAIENNGLARHIKIGEYAWNATFDD